MFANFSCPSTFQGFAGHNPGSAEAGVGEAAGIESTAPGLRLR